MVVSESVSGEAGGARDFRATHWSVVLAAGDTQAPGSAHALEQLCRTYWYPLYAFVRRRGYDSHEAEDLTQAFFTQLLEKKALGKVDPAKGKFRSFLLAAIGNFLNNEWDKAQRLKRGGGVEVFSFDGVPAEERYRLEPAHSESPEKIFERKWAQAVLERVVRQLQLEFTQSGQERRFEVLKAFLLSGACKMSYEDAAAQLGLTVNAVTAAIHRMRQRFRQLFRAEIANTVAQPADVDGEIRHLLEALGQ